MSSSLIGYLQDQVQQAVSNLAGVTRRRVLRSDGWFVRGSLFALVNRDARIVVRLDDDRAQAEAHALPGACGWVIGKKKPMRAWVLLPETFHDDPDAIATWVKRAWSLAPQKAAAKKPGRVARSTPKPSFPPSAAVTYVKRWRRLFDTRDWAGLATIDRARKKPPQDMKDLRLLAASGGSVGTWSIRRFRQPRWPIFRTYTLEPKPVLWVDIELVRKRHQPVSIWLALAPHGRGYRQCFYVERPSRARSSTTDR